MPTRPCVPRPAGERDLGQLRGLAGAGLAADDDHLMREHGRRAMSARRADTGKGFRKLQVG